jgi:divalent metal cation (Fe/Co/Zn/Cd) transporter
VGQRRGHRYKHSSISTQHQVIREAPPRPHLAIPDSLPVPTLREAWASMSTDQRRRAWWCLCHVLVASYLFFGAQGSLAMTGLSHLVFFDAGSAAVGAVVDVLGNFDVWRRSTISHPFGLERAEVLAGFAMSVFLLFGGFDLASHNAKHMLEGLGSHVPHHPHEHASVLDAYSLPGLAVWPPVGAEGGPPDPQAAAASAAAAAATRSPLLAASHRVSPGSVDVGALAAVVSTLVSAYGLKNHVRIARILRARNWLPDTLPPLLRNPFHFLTLSFSALMLLLPLLSVAYYVWLDRLICIAIAASMFTLGYRLAVAQGFMLLQSYTDGRSGAAGIGAGRVRGASIVAPANGSMEKMFLGGGGAEEEKGNDAVARVVREIERESAIVSVEDSQFWQVHYSLCMANLKVRVVRGLDDASVGRLRARIATLIQNRLGEGYGRGSSLRWEVTVQTSTDG